MWWMRRSFNKLFNEFYNLTFSFKIVYKWNGKESNVLYTFSFVPEDANYYHLNWNGFIYLFSFCWYEEKVGSFLVYMELFFFVARVKRLVLRKHHKVSTSENLITLLRFFAKAKKIFNINQTYYFVNIRTINNLFLFTCG